MIITWRLHSQGAQRPSGLQSQARHMPGLFPRTVLTLAWYGWGIKWDSNRWALNGAMIAPPLHLSSAVEIVQRRRACRWRAVGRNFQYRLVLGIDADLGFWAAKGLNQLLKYSGAVPLPGTYHYSDTPSPRGFAVIGPRIGYAGDTWLPYILVGTIIAAGSHGSTLYYTPTGAKIPTASFSGGKDFSSTGWVAGGGFELGLNGAWSITAEYLHSNFGKGSNSSGTCNGSVPACAAFSGITFDNIHEGFSANIVRVGITYWFGYWET
jgi:opacity protein-like surface antigen